MIWIVSFLVFALVLQVGLFFVIRKKKKEWKKNDILAKYDIKSRADLYKTLARQDLEEEDRDKLQKVYDADDDTSA